MAMTKRSCVLAWSCSAVQPPRTRGRAWRAALLIVTALTAAACDRARVQRAPAGLATRALVQQAWYTSHTVQASALTSIPSFGVALALQGDELAVLDHDVLYLFAREEGRFREHQQLRSELNSLNHGWGRCVVLSGDELWVASDAAESEDYYGMVVRHSRVGARFEETQRLSVQLLFDSFGAAIAAAPGAVAIGAPGEALGEERGQGAVYIYTLQGSSYTLQQRLVAGDDFVGQNFGIALAWQGDTLAVGATKLPGAPGPEMGAVYLFRRAGDRFAPLQKLVAAGSAETESFGSALAMSGTTLLVGAYADDPIGDAASGAAYLFEATGEAWTQRQRLTAADRDANTWFGSSLALAGDSALIGSMNTLRGRAFFFARTAQGFVEQQVLEEPGGYLGDGFGSVLALSGDTAVVSADWMSTDSQVHVWSLRSTDGSACSADASCGSGACVEGICCDTRCGACGTCADGTCRPRSAGDEGVPSCSPLVCDGADTACPAGCLSEAECSAGWYCEAGQCVERRAHGSACSSAAQCASERCIDGRCLGQAELGTACTEGDACATGHCVDGRCCDSACEDVCDGCDVAGAEGTCTAVHGAPHGSRACAGDVDARGSAREQDSDVCAGTCDGESGAACSYPGVTTPCDSECNDGMQTDSVCDGRGACVLSASYACANLQCQDATRCKTECTRDDDCERGFACTEQGTCQAAATCLDERTSQTSRGAVNDCAPYVCDTSGVCRTRCTTVADCVAPNVCDKDGRCGAPPRASSCALSARGAHTSAPWSWPLGLLALWCLRARWRWRG